MSVSSTLFYVYLSAPLPCFINHLRLGPAQRVFRHLPPWFDPEFNSVFLFFFVSPGFSVCHRDGSPIECPIECGCGCPGPVGGRRRKQSHDTAGRESDGQSDVHYGHAAAGIAAQRTQPTPTGAPTVRLTGQPTLDAQLRYRYTNSRLPLCVYIYLCSVERGPSSRRLGCLWVGLAGDFSFSCCPSSCGLQIRESKCASLPEVPL